MEGRRNVENRGPGVVFMRADWWRGAVTGDYALRSFSCGFGWEIVLYCVFYVSILHGADYILKGGSDCVSVQYGVRELATDV